MARAMRSIIIGVLFVIGGLSGGMVLRGTKSSGGLAVVGLVMIVFGVVQVSSKGGSNAGSEAVNFADPERDREQWEEYQRSKAALANKSGEPALTPEVRALIAATPGAAAQINEVLQRTKGHLDAEQTQEMVLNTAKQLAADYRRKQQAAGV